MPPRRKADLEYWDHFRGVLRTRKGGWVIGEAVYNQGYSMMEDLVGQASFFQVLALNATGRLPERRLADWLEAIFICLSWPDARIWCNQIGALAGNSRTTPVAAVTAGALAADSRMYGAGTLEAAVRFIVAACAEYEAGATPDEIIHRHGRPNPTTGIPLVVGYVRPIATGDERIAAMERVARELGFADGSHMITARAIEQAMQERYGEGINLAGYCAAFLCDQGFSATEIYRLHSLWVNSGVHACYAEACDNTAGTFLPLRCEDIDYTGPGARLVPAKRVRN